MRLVPNADFLVSMELDDLPSKFPRNCSLQGLKSEIMIGENYVCATFLELLGQTTGNQSREAVSGHLVKTVNLSIQAQKSITTHENSGSNSSTPSDVACLAHVNRNHKKSGWMSVLGEKLHGKEKTTFPSFEDRLSLIKKAIRNLVGHQSTSSFFQNCKETEFAHPESGEFVIASKANESESNKQNFHVDTLAPNIRIGEAHHCPLFTAVVNITEATGTSVSTIPNGNSASPASILRDFGEAAFKEAFADAQAEIIHGRLPPMTITIFRSNTVHAEMQEKEDFFCPYTQSGNRITWNFLFYPKIFSRLRNHPALSASEGFGTGIFDVSQYNVGLIKKDLLERAENFTLACDALFNGKKGNSSPRKRKISAGVKCHSLGSREGAEISVPR